MRRTMNFHVSRFVKTEEKTTQFAVFFLRLAPLGSRYSVGIAGLPPHGQARQAPRTFTLRETAENAVEALNAQDLGAKAG